MRVLFTICGRAGSKGIKNKNIRSFNGIPLPYYTISAIDLFLKKANFDIEADIVVNTDSKELRELCVNNKLLEVSSIDRDVELSGDDVGKIDVINDCLKKMEDRSGFEYGCVLDLDITSPLRTVNDIQRLIDKHIMTGADVTTSVTTARRNPFFNQLKKTENGYKKVIESNFTARQQAPEIFDMNASMYAYTPTFLRSGKGVLDGYCECIEMYDTGILDLDHENDLELMEIIAKYLFDQKDEFKEIRDNICMMEK